MTRQLSTISSRLLLICYLLDRQPVRGLQHRVHRAVHPADGQGLQHHPGTATVRLGRQADRVHVSADGYLRHAVSVQAGGE